MQRQGEQRRVFDGLHLPNVWFYERSPAEREGTPRIIGQDGEENQSWKVSDCNHVFACTPSLRVWRWEDYVAKHNLG